MTDKQDEILCQKAVVSVTILLIIECEMAGIIRSSTEDQPDNQLAVGNGQGEVGKGQGELISLILKCLGYITAYPRSGYVEQVFF